MTFDLSPDEAITMGLLIALIVLPMLILFLAWFTSSPRRKP